ncbi:MAG: long-chain fatty acid--CoA ligase [Treponema sp.]
MEQTLPKMLRQSAEKWPEINAQYARDKSGEFIPINYHDYYQAALDFAGALLNLGEKRGSRIGLISDNRPEWEQSDLGLLIIGAVDTPRGSDATEQDLSYILSFAECELVIAENTNIVKKILSIKESLPLVTRIISFDPIAESEQKTAKENNIQLFQFQNLVKEGHQYRIDNPDKVEDELEKGKWDDLATIIFTSGTTGTPKGVMLTHGNFLAQLDELQERIFLNPGERALCVLPVWHAFERLCEYVILSQGAALCYSKPVGSILLADLKKVNPQILPAVPRVFEAVYDGIWRKMRKTGGIVFAMFKFFLNVSLLWHSIDRKLRRKQSRFGRDWLGFWWPVLVLPWILIYPVNLLGQVLVFSKIRAMLGKNFRAGIAGGGAYPPAIDKFFWAVGINVVEGYGLTETAPVVSVRPVADPILGNVGTPIRGVEARVVDDDGYVLGRCKKGILQVRGLTVMKGYYKRDDLTAKVMTPDGWFDTGDIAILTVDGEICLRGRKKDTIVLLGGENVEPLPIEQRINTSQYISTSVVVGQDQRFLGALVLPSEEDIKTYAKQNNIAYSSYEELAHSEPIHKLLDAEINERICAKTGFKAFERVNRFEVITKPFEVGVELSAKQEMMRYRICEQYKKLIDEIYSK